MPLQRRLRANRLFYKRASTGTAVIASLALLILTPQPAYAHGQIPGIGDLLNGLLHPLITPAHILILLALGLYLGQQPSLKLKPLVIAFGCASACGLLVATKAGLDGISPPFIIFLAMGIATLVAFEKPAPVVTRVLLCVAAAAVLGLDSSPESGTASMMIKMLLGTWISLLVLVCDVAFYASLCQKKWLKIGIRILGSWIIAISFMVLAFYWKSAK